MMSASRPVPSRTSGVGNEFSSSFAASFRSSGSPIAQEAITRDLAECCSDSDEDEERTGSGADGRDGDSCVSESESECESPTLYRRPSGIAFGTARPALGPTHLDEAPVLTRVERKQSRDAERSLLRDNHILPPKHPAPGRRGFLATLYRRLFSTKLPVPRPGRDEEASPASSTDQVMHQVVPQVNIIPAETTPLLGSNGAADGEGSAHHHHHLSEQWEAAVAAGQIKTTWQREAKTLAVYSRSLVITFLLQYSISITSIFAVGRIGKLELGAVSLATMTANITCYAPLQGLATSLDTLCAQAYGSGHKHLVGLQLQRMTWFLLLLLLPIGALWLRAEDVLALMIPERRSAELAGAYLRVAVLGLPAFAVFEGSKRFVQAQGLFQATTYCLLFAAPLNVLISWLLVWRFGWGFIGAPVAVVITQNLLPVLLFLYVRLVDGYQCWGGFSKRALTNWGPMIRLALPGMIMVEAEYFAFEILTLVSGQFGTSALAAQSIIVTVTSTTYQIPFPLSVAASTRVANLIGAKLVDAAKMTAKVAVAAGVLIGLFNMTTVTSLRYQIPRLFTDDQEVIELVARVIPVCAVMQIFDGMAAVSHGLLRGVGRQEFGGYANLVTYYLVALPISFGTGLGLGWELSGLWVGVTVGLGLVALIEYWFLYVYDWKKAVADAETRNANE